MTNAWPQGNFPSTLADFQTNGADPMLADLAGAPSAIISGATPPSTVQSTVSQWMGATQPGSLDTWLQGLEGATMGGAAGSALGPLGAAAGSLLGGASGGASGSAASTGGWWSKQPLYIKGLIVVIFAGLVLIGTAALFFGHGGARAVEAAAG
jgi:hypothetical protein